MALGLDDVIVVVVCFVPSCEPDSASSAHAHGFDEVRMHPYDHPLHRKVLIHFIYIYKMEVLSRLKRFLVSTIS